ncbi:MAG: DUF4160 domain-containing protein [Deltaproteobacteria bacterium]|nr:DUF4160 domain-containing protein [Deltaproteobacteria bacterium]
MPEISRFYGIIIRMYYGDHEPPHFHIKYENYEAKISIADLKMLTGHLSRRALLHVLEWAFEHRQELFEDWELMKNGKPPKKINPLD